MKDWVAVKCWVEAERVVRGGVPVLVKEEVKKEEEEKKEEKKKVSEIHKDYSRQGIVIVIVWVMCLVLGLKEEEE